jgi:hypothetical protein
VLQGQQSVGATGSNSYPLLIFHSDTDVFDMTQSDEMFAGLMRLGKEARYVGTARFPCEHSPVLERDRRLVHGAQQDRGFALI